MSADKRDRSALPLTESKFEGVVGKTYADSKPDWPKAPKPPEGAPNVITGDQHLQAPFPFTGKVLQVDIELAPQNLSPAEETKLHEMETAFAGTHE